MEDTNGEQTCDGSRLSSDSEIHASQIISPHCQHVGNSQQQMQDEDTVILTTFLLATTMNYDYYDTTSTQSRIPVAFYSQNLSL